MELDSNAARVVIEPPASPPEAYVHGTPAWLMKTLRATFGLGGVGVAAMSASEWAEMPWFFRGLVCVLVPGFLFLAISARAWRNTPQFVADPGGVYFPCADLVVAKAGPAGASRWLRVPWDKISGLRAATVIDADGTTRGLAFDVAVPYAERADFFEHVDRPADRGDADEQRVFVAYAELPWRRASTLARLAELSRAQAAHLPKR